MGRLTATLAHEIKNPLAIIRGSAQRLGKLEPEAQRMADFVVEETDRLARRWPATCSSRAAATSRRDAATRSRRSRRRWICSRASSGRGA